MGRQQNTVVIFSLKQFAPNPIFCGYEFRTVGTIGNEGCLFTRSPINIICLDNNHMTVSAL